jgi:hypothetical protein
VWRTCFGPTVRLLNEWMNEWMNERMNEANNLSLLLHT